MLTIDVLGRADLRRAARRRDSKNSSSSNDVKLVPYSWLTVSRLIGIGSSWPSTQAQHAMLVRPPLGEPRQVLEDVARVGVEDVRPVLVDEDAGVVVVVVGVAADVRALVADQHLLAGVGGEPLGEVAAGEAGADDQIIEHGASSGIG